jgi:hypothetical protein
MRVLSNEQLTNLALHTAGINSILVEAMLAPLAPEEETEVVGEEIDVTILVVREAGEQSEAPAAAPQKRAEDALMDDLCGEWAGSGWRKPGLRIFRDGEGYAAVFLHPKTGKDISERHPMEWVNDNLCLRVGEGYVYLGYDPAGGKLKLCPGSAYTRAAEPKE